MSSEIFAAPKLLAKRADDRLMSLKNREYDLVISTLSWESRCAFAFKVLDRKFPEINLLKFNSSHRPEAEAKKNSHLDGFRAYADSCKVVGLESSISYSRNIGIIDKFLQKRFNEVGGPLRVLCDITCLPKSYLLLLLGFGFQKSLFARFDCMYAEGKYPLARQHAAVASGAEKEGSIISEGEWASIPVPFFESQSAIPSSRDVLVTLGGEVGLTLPFIEKYEPRRLGLVLISESEVQRPMNLPQSEQYALKELQSEPNAERVDIPIADVVGLSRYVDEFCRSSTADVVTALAVGCKTHALALGIAGLNQPKMEIICRIPKRYTMLDVEPDGNVVGYEIEDRFEPNAYLT